MTTLSHVHLTSAITQLTVQYRIAWKALWNTEPPVVRPVRNRGVERVVIVSEHGASFPLGAERFRSRIETMKAWAALSSSKAKVEA